MKDARVKGSSFLPLKFQRATKARQSIAGVFLNKEGPDRQWRTQEDIPDARAVTYLPRRAAYREWYHPKE